MNDCRQTENLEALLPKSCWIKGGLSSTKEKKKNKPNNLMCQHSTRLSRDQTWLKMFPKKTQVQTQSLQQAASDVSIIHSVHKTLSTPKVPEQPPYSCSLKHKPCPWFRGEAWWSLSSTLIHYKEARCKQLLNTSHWSTHALSLSFTFFSFNIDSQK